MTFIKRHSFVLLCGAAVVVALGLGGFGMTRGSDVVGLLGDGKQLADNIDRMIRTKNPPTVAAIDQMQDRIENLQRGLDAFLEEASRINRREPLVPKLFPKPEDDGLRYDFQSAYKEQFDRFLADLRAGQPPGRDELKNWKAMIDEEVRAFHQGETPRGFANVPSDVLARLPDEVRWDHEARASIWEARHAYCYAELTSFDVKASVYQPRDNLPPPMDGLWRAQTGLWVQQDIVGALVDINNARARELTEDSPNDAEEPWIGNLPVKQIVGIRVTGYLFEEENPPPIPEYKKMPSVFQARGARVSMDVGDPPTDVTLVLTQRGGSDEFDVMHVRVVLVVDTRYVPEIIDNVLKRNLFTLLNIRYRYVPMTRKFVGLLYGPDPVVQVELDFAIHWLTNIYYDMMPEEFKE